MAQNDDDDINFNNNLNNNDNDNNNAEGDNSPIQPRTFLGGILDYVTTPLRTRTRNDRQNLIDQQQQQQRNIRNLEADIGLGRAALFPDEPEEPRPEEKEEEKEDEEEDDAFTMPTTTYSLGGMSLEFTTEEPTQNTDYEVGVVISKQNRPTPGTDDETKLVERLCKNQYPKFKKAETSMKSVERLLQSRGIMDTIDGTTTLLDKYDMKEPFTVVFPTDPTLTKVALAMNSDGTTVKTINLLVGFRKVTKTEVALSCAWWNLHGFYLDKNNVKQSLGRDMNWSYLHFKNHVDESLYDDVNKKFHEQYEKKQRGGPLFFKLLVDTVLTSNEDSLSALVLTIKKYNIASYGKDDLLESIKILEAGVRTIKAMREDGSNRPQLPDKFVVDVITVLQTTSVDVFNEKMKAFHNNLDMHRLMNDETTINTVANLQKTFKMASNYHKELFDDGIWHESTMEKAKSSFVIFWTNRCWNCRKENCNKTRCAMPIDEARCERNRLEWQKENKKEPGGFTPVRRGNDKGGTRVKPFAWRPPEASENNKRTIYGRPHTWNGKSSWIEDQTPASGITDPPHGANVAGGTSPAIPTQVQQPSNKSNVGDDATVMTSETGMSQEQLNELRRVQANAQNLGANLQSVSAYLSTFTE